MDRIEVLYLKSLRVAVLLVATMLLIFALGWAAISLARVLRSPDSVVEKPSSVKASEILIADPQAEGVRNKEGTKGDIRGQRSYYDAFIKRYFALYQTKYQPSLRTDDKRLSIGEFDDLTINTAARIEAIQSGDLDFATDKNDLEDFLTVISEASASEATGDRLSKYRIAKKQPVSTQVQRTRTETRRGWDTYSTACVGWYESPIGCAVTRRVEVPYTQRVTAMRYPDGISSPNEVLKTYQDSYFKLLADRRRSNAEEAATERQAIAAGQMTGWAGLSKSVLVIGAFLTLMFFFLLVAIERHQRQLTTKSVSHA